MKHHHAPESENFSELNAAVAHVSNKELRLEWHKDCLDVVTKGVIQIGWNAIDAEKTIPKTSPVHTVLLGKLTAGVQNTVCAEVFEKNRKTIADAKHAERESDFAELRLPPINRDKLTDKMPLVTRFFGKLEVKSGTIYKVFFGGRKKCFEKYKTFCNLELVKEKKSWKFYHSISTSF